MEVEQILNDFNINYNEIEHEALYNVEQAQKIKGRIEGMGVKNLFLTDNNKKYYLVMIEENKKVDFKELKKLLGVNLKFSTEIELYNKLKLKTGSVTPLGILNDNGSVRILMDRELLHKKILIHPNVNTKTISIYTSELIKVINHFGNEIIYI